MSAAIEQLIGYANEKDLDGDGYEEFRSHLQRRYRFYVMNPAHSQGVEYSLYFHDGESEWPILSSNTGGFVTFNSRLTSVGDGLEPTDEFFTLVGLGFHEAMCFMPDIYLRDDHFERRYMSIYDEKPREYEVWAAHVLIDWLATGEQEIPEFEPLAKWASEHSEFGVPVLGEEPKPDDSSDTSMEGSTDGE